MHAFKALDHRRPSDPEADERELEALLDRVQPGWRGVPAERAHLPRMAAVSMVPAPQCGGTAGRSRGCAACTWPATGSAPMVTSREPVWRVRGGRCATCWPTAAGPAAGHHPSQGRGGVLSIRMVANPEKLAGLG